VSKREKQKGQKSGTLRKTEQVISKVGHVQGWEGNKSEVCHQQAKPAMPHQALPHPAQNRHLPLKMAIFVDAIFVALIFFDLFTIKKLKF
jgi:hypothetical protein